ncbi:TIR domain-containing protein [Rhizobium leguminosarum bv. viciae]|nr:TIR domain-containing protein [Rhizobium leguminosarum bv. viciae]
MSLTINGRPLSAGGFANEMENMILESAKGQLRDQFSAIRHPETGEFPTVIVHGEALDDLRLSVEGSPELIAFVRERMGPEIQKATSFVPVSSGPPKAFLSYSFEDRETAKKIAEGLMANGVDTWWAEWEIGAGDSLRRKIDEGLGGCTHFIVLLTPSAMERPWVQQEMDAGLVRRITGQARFIPLRHGLSTRDLPPLLSGMLSPKVELSQLDKNIRDLVNDIHGVSEKPKLGPPPSSTELPSTDFSKTATAVAKVFVEGTRTAMFADPQKTIEELARAVNASEEDIEDAVHELRDFVKESFGGVFPKASLFAQFDKHFMEWSPEDDALRIAADLINNPEFPHDTGEVAARYGWEPRRMNPALAYLEARQLIVDYKVLSSDFNSMRIVKTDATRRFVKSRS